MRRIIATVLTTLAAVTIAAGVAAAPASADTVSPNGPGPCCVH